MCVSSRPSNIDIWSLMNPPFTYLNFVDVQTALIQGAGCWTMFYSGSAFEPLLEYRSVEGQRGAECRCSHLLSWFFWLEKKKWRTRQAAITISSLTCPQTKCGLDLPLKGPAALPSHLSQALIVRLLWLLSELAIWQSHPLHLWQKHKQGF